MRIDKFLSNANFGSRSEIKKLIKQKAVKINDTIVKNGKEQINPSTDVLRVHDQKINLEVTKYLMLYKPQGVITATFDEQQQTVLDLIAPADRIKKLAPVGRLDKDTTGLLLLTNDGQLAHQLLAPKKHVSKTYQAKISGIVTSNTVDAFKAGIVLKDKTHCQPAILKIIQVDEKLQQSFIEVTITEGKYHQVKRMFAACNMKVLTLKRISMGNLTLDPQLKPGEYRLLSPTEINRLKNG